MRLSEIWDRDLAFAALKDEMKQLAATVRGLRQKRAISDVMRAEKRLIAAQVNARLLQLPIKVLGAGQQQCKGEREPYSLVKPKTVQCSSGSAKRTAK